MKNGHIMLVIAVLLALAAFGFSRPYRSKYYELSDFDSPDEPGSGERMQSRILKKLDLIIDDLGYVPPISSGFRTYAHNAQIGGASGSFHMQGLAVDIDTNQGNHGQILHLAEMHELHGIGDYNGHIHIDMGPPGRRWTGKSR